MKKKKENKFMNKGKIIGLSIIIIVVIVGILIFRFYNTNNGVSIEVGSNNVSYIYGPNNETIIKMKPNEGATIKIIATSGKSKLVKCFSKDENIIKFIDKNNIRANALGETEIYCTLKDVKSNVIKIKVSE